MTLVVLASGELYMLCAGKMPAVSHDQCLYGAVVVWRWQSTLVT
jgi:hypothetical protein